MNRTDRKIVNNTMNAKKNKQKNRNKARVRNERATSVITNAIEHNSGAILYIEMDSDIDWDIILWALENCTLSEEKKGLSIDSLLENEIFSVVNQPSKDSCPICLENLNNNSQVIRTKCKHDFHYDCIKHVRNDNCPCCRELFDK